MTDYSEFSIKTIQQTGMNFT